MTGDYVKQSAELYVGSDLDPADALMIINEATETIGDLALNYNEIDIVIAGGGNSWVSFPSDTTAIIIVYDEFGEIYELWSSRGTKVKIEDAGDYKAIIRQMVPKLTSLANEIQIHPLFNTAIIAYVRGFMKMRDDDSSPDGQAQMQKFTEEVQKAHVMLSAMRKRN